MHEFPQLITPVNFLKPEIAEPFAEPVQAAPETPAVATPAVDTPAVDTPAVEAPAEAPTET